MEQMSFQGNLQEPNYFEGWYYKQVTGDKKNSVILIPGISLNPEDSHAFIQTYDTFTKQSHYFRFSKEQFVYQKEPFVLSIGENVFKKEMVKLDLEEEDYKLQGEFYFTSLSPIKESLYAPTIMGPFSYFKMECNHAIISMDHYVDGTVWINHKRLEFEDGYGYIEKDYGTSFPKKYMWFQSNTPKKEVLDHKKVSIVFSIASIPVWKFHFRGFFCVFLVGMKEYRFSTYNFAKIKEIKKKDHRIYQIRLKKNDYDLKIVVKVPDSFYLPAPNCGRMQDMIQESLNAEATVTLKQLKKTVIKQRLISCGFEDHYF